MTANDAVRVFTDRRCLGHRAPAGYPERPERLAGILQRLAPDWPIVENGAHPASRELVGRVHRAEYVERFERAAARGDGLLDSADNPLSPGTWPAAWGAVDATLHAADHAAAGGRAFAAVRPPGHHAEAATAMGYCYFNNAAIAAEYLRYAHGLERVAVVDFDVHHGNGTQHLFYERSDVWYGSLHQYPFYPGTGARAETGSGDGWGATLNLPLPAGTDDAGYAAAFEDALLPELRRFAPRALVVSAGFDAWLGDPLGGMRVSAAGFEQWSRWLAELAAEVAGGRLVAVLEGGYDLTELPDLVVACLRGLGRGHGKAQGELRS